MLTSAEKEAQRLRFDRAKLKDYLLEAKSCLMPIYKKHFKKSRFDFDSARLYGDSGYYLQWKTRHFPDRPISYENQQTTVGRVELHYPETETHNH